GSTEGDVLGGRGHLHGDVEDGGGGGAHGLGAGGAADEKDSADRDTDVGHGGKPVGQAEEHAFDGGAGHVLRGHVRAGEVVQGAGRFGQFGGAFPVQGGQEYKAVGSGWGGQGQTVEPGRVGAEHAGRGTEHTCGVECGHERQVAAGGIGESADGAAGVLCG